MQQIMKQIQSTQAELAQLEDQKFLASEDGEDTAPLEKRLSALRDELEGFQNEYQAELRQREDNMDLGKWVDTLEQESFSIRPSVEGLSNPWLEAMCYASICQACQFRWSSTLYFVEQARERMLLSPENEDAYERYHVQNERKEEIEKLWLAAERAYDNAAKLVEGIDPPKQYFKSHDKAIQDAYNFFETRQQASRATREKQIAMTNDIDENQRKLFLNALPSVKIY